jgi:hypothetical protein
MNITISPFRGRDLLPQTSRLAECQAASGLCFDAGDSRATENPGLSVLHTVMVREHNRIAGQLQTFNRQWDDERLYMTSRKINGAIWQHVIYNEYLPRVLGWNAINLYGLNLLTEGFYEGYDSNCNAGIFNEFSTAAYRFGHSLVRPFFPRVDASFQVLYAGIHTCRWKNVSFKNEFPPSKSTSLLPVLSPRLALNNTTAMGNGQKSTGFPFSIQRKGNSLYLLLRAYY